MYSGRKKASAAYESSDNERGDERENSLIATRRIPSFIYRLWQSTIGFHRLRFIAGMTMAILFLEYLFMPLAWVDPTASLYPIVVGVKSLVPLVASLGVGAMATPLLAIMGALLLLTAPKWIGNLLQFMGDRLLASVVNRITMIPYLIVREIGKALGIIDDTGIKKINTGTKVYSLIEGFFYLFPAITYYIGKGLNYVGVVLSGEYNHSEMPDPVYFSHSCSEVLLALPPRENFDNPKFGNATQSAKADPGLIWPEAGIKLSEFYDKGMNALAAACPLPSLYQHEVENHNRPAFKSGRGED